MKTKLKLAEYDQTGYVIVVQSPGVPWREFFMGDSIYDRPRFAITPTFAQVFDSADEANQKLIELWFIVNHSK